jgi:poly(A) polymerase
VTDHGIKAKHLDANALKVIDELNANGFQAFLVGGCVRDALCGERPKDFDVATNAPLEKISKIFRRARIVGRRFPIVHVRYGRDLIEVSTFRQSISDNVVHDQQGMILRDHAFGTMQEDAFRRDFSVNALYYDPNTNEIIDYVGGIKDIEAKRLRFIGETKVRLAEDPVRVLRALRFGEKLGFSVDKKILALLDDTAKRLDAVPPARLFDEFLKLFLNGYGEKIWRKMRDTKLAGALFPTCNPQSPLVLAAMRNTDERIRGGASITPGFLVAVLLWEDFCARKNEWVTGDEDPAFATLKEQQNFVAVPRRFGSFAREVWMTQDRLINRSPKAIERVSAHKRFRAGYDFLCLRAETESNLKECADWWTHYQTANSDKKQAMVQALPRDAKKKRRKKRVNKDKQPISGELSAES